MTRAKQQTKETIRDELSKAVTNEISYSGAHYSDELRTHLSNVHGVIDVLFSTLIEFPPTAENQPRKTVSLEVDQLAGFCGLLKREVLIAGYLLDAAVEQVRLDKGMGY